MNFDVFLVDFDAKTQMRGENLPKNYKNGLVDWFGRKNVTITISIHCQKCNGYPVQSWTGWTDWTDQSKLGLVTHTLDTCIPKSSNSSRGYDYNLFQSSNEDEGIIRGRESSELYRNKLHNMKKGVSSLFFHT